MPVEPNGRMALPIACTLGPNEGRERLEQWRRLATAAGRGRVKSDGVVRLRFADGPGVEAQLGDLVAAERECCAFLSWRLESSEEGWCVEIRGSDQDLDALPISG